VELATQGSDVNQEIQEAWVKNHAQLVKRIAYHLLAKLPSHVQVEDLIQAGMLGLLEAFKHYDASKGASFETYAGIRIKGYMLDEVRKNDWVPRSVYRNARRIAQAVQQVENRLGREAKDAEIAQELDLPLEAYHHMLQDSASAHFADLDDLGITEDMVQIESPDAPQAQVLQEDFLQRLVAVVDGLPDKERLVLSLYYEQDLNLKEIGAVLEVSESRVSQILTQATLRIRARLKD
jgi:RNA polymerase sigma factor for flagellar operon FliA